MRKLAQILLIVLIVTYVPSKTFAQLPKALVFGNFTYASPQGNFANSYNNGTGFEVGGGIGFGKNVLYASTGYITYSGNNIANYKVVPVKIGLRRYLLLGLFLNGAVGVANQSYVSATSSNFLHEFGAGFKMLGLFEAGAAYTGWTNNGSSLNALLLKAGLSIKL